MGRWTRRLSSRLRRLRSCRLCRLCRRCLGRALAFCRKILESSLRIKILTAMEGQVQRRYWETTATARRKTDHSPPDPGHWSLPLGGVMFRHPPYLVLPLFIPGRLGNLEAGDRLS